MSYLFGNILAISWTDLAIVGMTVIIIFGLMIRHWRKLVFVAFDKTYAKISGLNVEQIDIWFNIALAITVVLGIKLVGIVLINALLVIPALILRMFARSMKSMLIWTPVVSCVITLLGILISFVINLPTGPVITLTAGVIFLISVLLSQFRFARHKL
jgi:zinc transport system permease protein